MAEALAGRPPPPGPAEADTRSAEAARSMTASAGEIVAACNNQTPCAGHAGDRA
jgi:hypothetical protein